MSSARRPRTTYKEKTMLNLLHVYTSTNHGSSVLRYWPMTNVIHSHLSTHLTHDSWPADPLSAPLSIDKIMYFVFIQIRLRRSLSHLSSVSTIIPNILNTSGFLLSIFDYRAELTIRRPHTNVRRGPFLIRLARIFSEGALFFPQKVYDFFVFLVVVVTFKPIRNLWFLKVQTAW